MHNSNANCITACTAGIPTAVVHAELQPQLHLYMQSCKATRICACRAAKPMRDLEEIMLREQKLAADADKAEADDAKRIALEKAAAAEKANVDAARLTRAASSATVELEEQLTAVHASVNQADAMELCSTSEVLELFAEYYEDDRKEIDSNFLLNDKSTNNDIDFDHPAFAGTASAVSCAGLARAVVGSNDEQFDISNLISD